MNHPPTDMEALRSLLREAKEEALALGVPSVILARIVAVENVLHLIEEKRK